MFSLLSLLFALHSHAAVIYQGATASLSNNLSLVTYTTKMIPLVTPDLFPTLTADNPTPILINRAPPQDDNNYINGIYNCAVQGTYSVGASIGVTGTIAVFGTATVKIQVSADGSNWYTMRSLTNAITAVFPTGSVYNAALVPCPAGGKIRVMASTTVVLPSLTTAQDENVLLINKIF